MQFVQFIRDALSLLFPELCAGCSEALIHQERQLCTHCIYNLPVTNFHLDSENLAAKQLMGRVPISAAVSFLYFTSGSIVQKIIHQIKYKNGFATAEFMGELYGQRLQDLEEFKTCDLIIPVPLHKKRQRSRGYNQSAYFARGLSKMFQVETSDDNLIRITHTESQTKSKNRYERFKNMRDLFKIKNPDLLKNKHILLVDDVLTTGATLEACSATILEIPGVKVSIATLAFTK